MIFSLSAHDQAGTDILNNFDGFLPRFLAAEASTTSLLMFTVATD